MCGNIPSCFAPLDDRGDRTNHMKSASSIETLECLVYFSFTSSSGKGRVFCSADKCFETGADPRSIFDKQILKVWTPCLSAFYCVIPRATLAWSLKACAVARFSKSARADKKLQGATLSCASFPRRYNRHYFPPNRGTLQTFLTRPNNKLYWRILHSSAVLYISIIWFYQLS